MAKKKKQKKAGIEKRRKNKIEKKSAQKRKLQAQKPVQQKISPSKLKSNLKNLPSLIFEPELEEIAFSSEQLKAVTSEFEKVPDQIEALGSPEFEAQLKERLESLKARFDEDEDVNKGMMVHAILYFMEQEDAPLYLNQIAVAMYYNALYQLENEEPITLKQLNIQLRDYDKTWGDYLKEKTKQTVSPMGEDEIEEEEELEPVALGDTLFDEISRPFSEYLDADTSLDEDTRERVLEDAEALLNDYGEEKGITSLDDFRARKVRNFLESWFIRMMNPTQEDMENMIESLKLLFTFFREKELLSSEKTEDILSLLEDGDAFVANLNV